MPARSLNYTEVWREYKKCQEVINSFKDFESSVEATVYTDENLEINIKKLISWMQSHPSCVEYMSLNKMLAIFCLMDDREVEAIYHLIESHAVLLHLQVQHRWNKTQEREMLLEQPQTFGLNPAYIKFNGGEEVRDCASAVTDRLKEFPEEWYMVQLTAQYQSSKSSIYNTSEMIGMVPIHISVLPTGKNGIHPFCITVPKPKLSTNYDICKEIRDILRSNRIDLQATYANHRLYWKMRDKQNKKMKVTICELESTWLREWRVLLVADPIEESSLVKDVREMINKLITDNKSSNCISERTRWLLHKIALGACFLTRTEIALAIKYILPLDEKLCDNIILSIYGKLNSLTPLMSVKRKTLVLIVDEILDYIPFEVIDVLTNHPVTRFPSLHMAYALYKEHEETIENGCKIIKIGENNGSFMVNPSGNLPELEKRMKLFIEYWLPHWTGTYNIQPDEKSFECALTNYDILMYSGHGSGIQYLSGERIEKLRVKAIVLLFGCGSAKLWSVGGRFPPIGVSNQYLIACSPCILGMLWEVTDFDVDRLTANFIGNWIPSPAPRPWSEVKINEWSNGILEFKNMDLENGISTMSLSESRPCQTSVEPEMLRALAKYRGSCTHYMTMAAVVIRGLPIRLK
ncbi:separin isoform X2 [Diprion similis]|uniref:separin isoform X2 n=1 Tax=Diprion similis TaxID=362088 RepID=UPI001EF81490|nr:separin isoform X2 [Diprion similis]